MNGIFVSSGQSKRAVKIGVSRSACGHVSHTLFRSFKQLSKLSNIAISNNDRCKTSMKIENAKIPKYSNERWRIKIFVVERQKTTKMIKRCVSSKYCWKRCEKKICENHVGTQNKDILFFWWVILNRSSRNSVINSNWSFWSALNCNIAVWRHNIFSTQFRVRFDFVQHCSWDPRILWKIWDR